MTPEDQNHSKLNPAKSNSGELQLPEPSSDARAQSDALVEAIGKEIHSSGGAIEFERFMEMALYEPGLGYYVAGSHKFGADGDFVTAPELGDLFGATLAHQVSDVFGELSQDEQRVLEFGAGTGALAATMLTRLNEIDALPVQYLILEPSPELQARQRECIGRLPAELGSLVEWINTLPVEFSGVVVANEVLDAMPVSRYQVRAGGVSSMVVTSDNTNAKDELALGWRDLESSPQVVNDLVETHGLPELYEVEINTFSAAWVKSIGQMLQRGLVLLVDYGYVAREYYLPERSAGTLRCHYRHYAHGDPIFLPGLQDITCHVDFTSVAAAADACGLEVAGFSSQGAFLLSLGMLDIAGDRYTDDAADNAMLAKEVMTLTGPNTMGESFKVMALSRGITSDLAGFSMHDHRARL